MLGVLNKIEHIVNVVNYSNSYEWPDLSTLAGSRRLILKVNWLIYRFGLPWFKDQTIVASNDINEDTLLSLKQQVSNP